MTDTAAHMSLLEKAKELLRHKAHALAHEDVVVEVVQELHIVKDELEKLKAEVAALKAKDGPVVEQVAHDAAAVAADAEKATGA